MIAEHKLQALQRLMREKGGAWTVRFIAHRVVLRYLCKMFERTARQPIARWVADHDQRVHIYVSTVDYRYPYRQRTRHLVDEFVRRGLPVIYITPSSGYDRVFSMEQVASNLILTPHLDCALAACERPVVHILSTDAQISVDTIDVVQRRNGIVIYDYIDAIDDAVSSGAMTVSRRQLHRALLQDEENTFVVATASALLDDVASTRKRRYALVTNGVDPSPFSTAIRSNDVVAALSAVIAQRKPIIGYYGSFAKWFDYDLLHACVRSRPQYSFVVIGPDLDGTRARLDASLPNLTLIGGMEYRDLPRHAVWFDVCFVPFVINEITIGTSPLKIFEYMSLGRPTVSTKLPECLKYRSVLTASGAVAVGAAIDTALTLSKDDSFRHLAQHEAEANSWRHKVDQIIELLADGRADRPAIRDHR